MCTVIMDSNIDIFTEGRVSSMFNKFESTLLFKYIPV